jgi:putative ABC transport system ATP-binding protein
VIACRQLAYRNPGGVSIRFDDSDVPQGGLLLHSASGSGKSTPLALALAAALLMPAEGDIQVAGQSLKRLRGAAADAWRAQTVGFCRNGCSCVRC